MKSQQSACYVRQFASLADLEIYMLEKFLASHLLPQVPDMHHNGIVAVFVVLLLPDLPEQFLGANHLSPVLTEQPQNIKFQRGQGQLPLIISTFMGNPV